jgi:hypothetical protein
LRSQFLNFLPVKYQSVMLSQKPRAKEKTYARVFATSFFGEWNMRLANVAQLTDKYREIFSYGTFLSLSAARPRLDSLARGARKSAASPPIGAPKMAVGNCDRPARLT